MFRFQSQNGKPKTIKLPPKHPILTTKNKDLTTINSKKPTQAGNQ